MIGTLKSRVGLLLRAAKGYLCDIVVALPPFPEGSSLVSIGKTVQEKDINMVRIGNGPFGIVFCGAIHGNEAGTVKLMRFLVAYLGRMAHWHASFSFFCIGALNMDGYEIALAHPDYLHGGRIGRFNANGVDLNRNFPTASFTQKSVWSHGKGYAETTEVFCGASPGSGPENEALRNLVIGKDVKLLVMFHSVCPDVMGSADPLGQRLVEAFSAATGYPNVTHEEWVALGQTGTAREWCEENGISYLEIEASERWGSDWKRQKPGLEAVLSCLSSEDPAAIFPPGIPSTA